MRAAALLCAALLSASCLSTSSPKPAPLRVRMADFVAAIADAAAGGNASMAEAGLVLKTIEFRLAVVREEIEGAELELLLLEAGSSAERETSFLEVFVLEMPAARGPRAVAAPAVPGVAEFVASAMDSARDLARAAREQGLPQRLAKVELEAKLFRSRRDRGGVAFAVPIAAPIGVEAAGSSARRETNTIRLTFVAAPGS